MSSARSKWKWEITGWNFKNGSVGMDLKSGWVWFLNDNICVQSYNKPRVNFKLQKAIRVRVLVWGKSWAKINRLGLFIDQKWMEDNFFIYIMDGGYFWANFHMLGYFWPFSVGIMKS